MNHDQNRDDPELHPFLMTVSHHVGTHQREDENHRPSGEACGNGKTRATTSTDAVEAGAKWQSATQDRDGHMQNERHARMIPEAISLSW